MSDDPPPRHLTWETDEATNPDAPDSEKTTQRMCRKCGAPLGRDDGAFNQGGVHVLITVQAKMVRDGFDVVALAKWIQEAAEESGILTV